MPGSAPTHTKFTIVVEHRADDDKWHWDITTEDGEATAYGPADSVEDAIAGALADMKEARAI